MCILCDPGKPQFHSTSRRNFLKGTAATGLAAGAMTLLGPSAEAQGHNVIRRRTRASRAGNTSSATAT